MRILAICGCGMGSSVILKMNAQKALDSLGIEAEISVSDITTGKGAARDADLVLIGKELADMVTGIKVPIIVMDSFVNKKEVKDKLETFFSEKGLLK